MRTHKEYQKALDELCNCAMEYEHEHDYDYEENEIGGYVEVPKHELNRIKKPLQELIDRTIPKKAILVSDFNGYVYECPICHQDFRPNYFLNHIQWKGCPYCLHELDWGKINENI